MTDASDITRPKIIGARIKRTEDPRLLAGRGAFVDDRQVPNLLHVAFRRSDHAHARIRAIDGAATLAALGVVAVLTPDDLENVVKPLAASSRMKGYYATPIRPLARPMPTWCSAAACISARAPTSAPWCCAKWSERSSR